MLVPKGAGRDAERLFERLQADLRDRPLRRRGALPPSRGGVAEFRDLDDAAALLGRADAALALAKGAADTVVMAGRR